MSCASISAQATAFYYARTGKTLYLLLCGGDKGSQNADIKNAHAIWGDLNPPVKKPAKKE